VITPAPPASGGRRIRKYLGADRSSSEPTHGESVGLGREVGWNAGKSARRRPVAPHGASGGFLRSIVLTSPNNRLDTLHQVSQNPRGFRACDGFLGRYTREDQRMFGRHSGSGGFSPLWLLASVIIGSTISTTQCSSTRSQPTGLSFRHTTAPDQLLDCTTLEKQRASYGTSTFPCVDGAVVVVTGTTPSATGAAAGRRACGGSRPDRAVAWHLIGVDQLPKPIGLFS